jgi:hypothetical protein
MLFISHPPETKPVPTGPDWQPVQVPRLPINEVLITWSCGSFVSRNRRALAKAGIIEIGGHGGLSWMSRLETATAHSSRTFAIRGQVDHPEHGLPVVLRRA